MQSTTVSSSQITQKNPELETEHVSEHSSVEKVPMDSVNVSDVKVDVDSKQDIPQKKQKRERQNKDKKKEKKSQEEGANNSSQSKPEKESKLKIWADDKGKEEKVAVNQKIPKELKSIDLELVTSFQELAHIVSKVVSGY